MVNKKIEYDFACIVLYVPNNFPALFPRLCNKMCLEFCNIRSANVGNASIMAMMIADFFDIEPLTLGNMMTALNLFCWFIAFLLYVKTTFSVKVQDQDAVCTSSSSTRPSNQPLCDDHDPKIKFAMQRAIGSFKLVVHGVAKLNQSAPGQELNFAVSKIISASENFRYAMKKLDDEIEKIESKKTEEQHAMEQEDKN